jgi:hypothetical protein
MFQGIEQRHDISIRFPIARNEDLSRVRRSSKRNRNATPLLERLYQINISGECGCVRVRLVDESSTDTQLIPKTLLQSQSTFLLLALFR